MPALPQTPDEHRTLNLLSRIRDGDDEAWTALYRLHHDDLLFLIRRQLGPKLRSVLQSEDILQSVALEAFRDLPRFEPRAQGSLRAFLHKLVMNKIRDRADFHSAKKRGAALSLETSMLDDVGQGDGPRFYDSERYERLERALDRLPDDMRQAIVLRRFEGLSSREAADAMGKSDDAMRKLYSRALARLTLLVSRPDERSSE
ncbi:MAG: sigma-70 family RNA polymerase sigma factor [Planctomycetes bacterium]|nr:sigma-70 family RNA polymerase sigma factor [Planctomycetota bacterium]